MDFRFSNKLLNWSLLKLHSENLIFMSPVLISEFPFPAPSLGAKLKMLQMQCCGGYTAMLWRLYSNVAEAIQPCCEGYTAMLRRLYSRVAEAIQLCCGGYTVMLRRLYSHVAEAIRVLLQIIIPPQHCFELFRVLWQ